METYEDAQRQISFALVLARSMADVVNAARDSSMEVLVAAAADLIRAGDLVAGAAGHIKALRNIEKLSTTAELKAKLNRKE